MRQRSPWPRAMAFAVLGAAEVITVEPDDALAHSLLSDAADAMSDTTRHGRWPWLEPRLTYANATLPESMIAAGSALGRPILQRRGLDLLEWLLDRETRLGHLSVTPVGGSGPEDHGPRIDQQPIEAAALADACARAQEVDRNPRWLDGINAAADWFLGHNDGGVVMWDPTTGVPSMAWRNMAPISTRHRVDAGSPHDAAARAIPGRRLAMSQRAPSLVRRSPVHIAADRSRVVTRLFVPGQEGFDQQESRSSAVLGGRRHRPESCRMPAHLASLRAGVRVRHHPQQLRLSAAHLLRADSDSGCYDDPWLLFAPDCAGVRQVQRRSVLRRDQRR